MHPIVKILIPLVLAIAVFGAAKYLDNNPRNVTAEELHTSAHEETTVPTETMPAAISTEAAETPAVTVPETTASTEPEAQQERFVLTFVGDCTFGGGLVDGYAQTGFLKTVGDDYSYPFRNVISYLENDDATFANLEGTLTDTGNPVEKTHVFRGPQSYVQILTDNSIDFVSLANNHTGDYAETGYHNTKSTLDAAGVPYVERDMSTLITLDSGVTVGIYGTVYYSFNLEDMKQEIQAMKAQGADLIVVAAHWGVEGSYRITEEQEKVGHAAIDAGADIVWGAHPHVLQPIEEYNGGIIYYSLGNFSFGGNTAPKDYDSALISQEIVTDEQGNVSLGEYTIVPVRISSMERRNNFQPTPYESGTEGYNRVLKKLNGTWES